MRSKVIPTDFESVENLEEAINKSLEEMSPSRAEFAVSIKMASGRNALAIFYSPKELPLPDKIKKTICKQCRKTPAEDGIKLCSSCKEYQKKYREKRKAILKSRYP